MDTQELIHRPVLLKEALELLNIRADGLYVDGTFGRGGHSRAILAQLGPQGGLLALDRDPDAIREARLLSQQDGRLRVAHTAFSRLAEVVDEYELRGRLAGVLLDLGVSSPQLDAPERGFGFLRDGPLDMRMDPDAATPSAADWLAVAAEAEIATVLKEYGEERYARRIARAIVRERAAQPFVRTGQLAQVVADAHPAWEKGKHPATRSFQAIRIHINKELDEVSLVLKQALDVLAPGGRLAVISFHSLEDRLVKRFFRDAARGERLPKGVPVTHEQLAPKMKLLNKGVRPGEAEVAENPRSRSAILRAAEKLQ